MHSFLDPQGWKVFKCFMKQEFPVSMELVQDTHLNFLSCLIHPEIIFMALDSIDRNCIEKLVCSTDHRRLLFKVKPTALPSSVSSSSSTYSSPYHNSHEHHHPQNINPSGNYFIVMDDPPFCSCVDFIEQSLNGYEFEERRFICCHVLAVHLSEKLGTCYSGIHQSSQDKKLVKLVNDQEYLDLLLNI